MKKLFSGGLLVCCLLLAARGATADETVVKVTPGLIENGGFEGAYVELKDDYGFLAPGWIVRDGYYPWGLWSADPDSPHGGRFSQKMEIKAKIPKGTQQNNNRPLSRNKEYIFSLWHKGLAGSVSLIGFQWNPRKDILLIDDTAPAGKFEPGSNWAKYEIKFQPAEDCVNFVLRISAPGPGTIWIDDVSLTEQ